MEERLNKLESLAALQDQTIQSLNQELFRQQQDQKKLLQRLENLEEFVRKLHDSDNIVVNERPPHW
ncbi:SlyX family protein [Pontiella sp.]|uniref:SlyX family protein n=1 Tax=Pontiella sp. TaxID=2837462 RepID=UPI0035612DA4